MIQSHENKSLSWSSIKHIMGKVGHIIVYLFLVYVFEYTIITGIADRMTVYIRK